MTTRDVEKLLAGTQGRICARLYKRFDGTVLTKDCPVGIRVIRRRVSRVAGACVTAVFSFCLTVMGQRATQEEKSCPNRAKITIEKTDGHRFPIRGIVKDPNGAVIAGAPVTLENQNTKKILKTVSNDEGLFQFPAVEIGSYDLRLNVPGFRAHVVGKIEVEANQAVNLDLQMDLEVGSTFIGIVGENPQLDSNSSTLKTVFNTNQITKLPF